MNIITVSPDEFNAIKNKEISQVRNRHTLFLCLKTIVHYTIYSYLSHLNKFVGQSSRSGIRMIIYQCKPKRVYHMLSMLYPHIGLSLEDVKNMMSKVDDWKGFIGERHTNSRLLISEASRVQVRKQRSHFLHIRQRLFDKYSKTAMREMVSSVHDRNSYWGYLMTYLMFKQTSITTLCLKMRTSHYTFYKTVMHGFKEDVYSAIEKASEALHAPKFALIKPLSRLHMDSKYVTAHKDNGRLVITLPKNLGIKYKQTFKMSKHKGGYIRLDPVHNDENSNNK